MDICGISASITVEDTGIGRTCGPTRATSAESVPRRRCFHGFPHELRRRARRAMKVVLFCGGLGTRLREHSDTIPKPLVNIGYRPIIWHLMRYYAHFGHKDFILCLGYRGDLIKEYFVNYSEWMSNDFVLTEGGRKIVPLQNDIQDWRITFVETGLHSNIGERLLAVRDHLRGEEQFFANYSDALSDLPLDEYSKTCDQKNAVASFVSVRTWQSFHSVSTREDGIVNYIGPMRDS